MRQNYKTIIVLSIANVFTTVVQLTNAFVSVRYQNNLQQHNFQYHHDDRNHYFVLHHNPDRSSEVLRFIDFLNDDKECEGLDGLEIGYDDSNNRRGVFAKESYKSGDFILAIPFTSTLLIDETIDNDTDEPSDVMKGYILWNKYLSYYNNTNKNNEWKSYLDCLPTRTSNFDPTPDFWDESILQLLQMPKIEIEAKERKKEIDTISTKYKIDPLDLQMSTYLVRSRAFTTMKVLRHRDNDNNNKNNNNNTRQLRTRTVLIPYVDFINHSFYPNVESTVIETNYDDESFFAIQAITDIECDDEITIQYGTGFETSLDLLSKYGFYTVDNANDTNLDLSNVTWDTTIEEDEELLLSLLQQQNKVNDQTSNSLTMIDAIQLRIHLKRIASQQNNR